MMKGKKVSVAVRKKTGEIVVRDYPSAIASTSKWRKIPIIRGVLVLWEALFVGINVLGFSAQVAGEDVKLSKKDIILSILLAFGFGILLFSILPLLLASIFSFIRNNEFLFSLTEGIIRTIVLLLYVWIIGFIPDIKRVFQYHGAEHKSVYTYEAGEDLTVENARKYSTLHPRCGTSFLMITMVAAIIVFSLLGVFGRLNFIERFLSRILLIPLIAGLAFEFQRFTAKYIKNPVIRVLALPGLLLQKLTTREPTDDQLEVGLVALKASLDLEWRSNVEIEENTERDIEDKSYNTILVEEDTKKVEQ
ncbi:MAG TPA: DUF1385 domain-containing protein [Thermotogaceae bacterium]|nr:DUF1385 domain-containing protein [Thermotogota bacterium]HEW92804.1 DUF1385 domain-containing protein [Thermotogaceae bacterium]